MTVAFHPFPNLIFIGVQASAASWLRSQVARLPEVFMAERELRALTVESPNLLDEYGDAFSGWRGERVIGQFSPACTLPRRRPAMIAARIDGALPGAKLVVVLRNPVDRAYAAFQSHISAQRLGIDEEFLAYVLEVDPDMDPLSVISAGWYGASLIPFVARFNERLHIIFEEDLVTHPLGTFRAMMRFLCIDGPIPDAITSSVGSVTTDNLPWVPDVERRRPLVENERALVGRLYIDDTRMLEDLIGRQAPWARSLTSSQI